MSKQTIKLNNRPYPFTDGATITSLMAENGFDFPSIIVKVNGKLIEDERWPVTEVAAGDDVEIIHVFGGG